jgi:hypothetical protein
MHLEPPAITFIPCEEHFRPVLPTIEGNVDYLAVRGQLTTMDELLRTSGVDSAKRKSYRIQSARNFLRQSSRRFQGYRKFRFEWMIFALRSSLMAVQRRRMNSANASTTTLINS